eukprot:Nk52_evm79s221 gene=Nk52_evmTU79s221
MPGGIDIMAEDTGLPLPSAEENGSGLSEPEKISEWGTQEVTTKSSLNENSSKSLDKILCPPGNAGIESIELIDSTLSEGDVGTGEGNSVDVAKGAVCVQEIVSRNCVAITTQNVQEAATLVVGESASAYEKENEVGYHSASNTASKSKNKGDSSRNPTCQKGSPKERTGMSKKGSLKMGNITFKDLLDAGIIAQGEFLEFRGHTAAVQPEGDLVDEEFQRFVSPSGWAKYVTNMKNTTKHLQVSGWDRVKYCGQPIKVLRQKFLDGVACGIYKVGKERDLKRPMSAPKSSSKLKAKSPKKRSATKASPKGKRSKIEEKAEVEMEEVESEVLQLEECDSALFSNGVPVVYSSSAALPEFCCYFCGSAGREEEGDFVRCRLCNESYHLYCMDNESQNAVLSGKVWRCLNCISCEICRKSEPDSDLLVCDVCDEGYHLGCLSPPLDSVPEDLWMCGNCAKNGDTKGKKAVASSTEQVIRCPVIVGDVRRCLLCQGTGDDLPTRCGRLLNVFAEEWVHIKCAVWSAEVLMAAWGGLQDVDKAIKRGKRSPCSHCNGKLGATVGCHDPKCKANFHYACAVEAGCDLLADFKTVYCSKHKRSSYSTPVLDTSNYAVLKRVYVERPYEQLHMRMKKILAQGCTIGLKMGSFNVLSLGKLTECKEADAPHHSESALYPLGYRCERLFCSRTDPNKIITYSCSIAETEDGSSVVFQVKSGDNETEKWSDLLENSKTLFEDVYSLPGRSACYFSGETFFGIGSPYIQPFLEMLPGAEKCYAYEFKYLNIERAPREMKRELPVNPSGCARGEKFKRVSTQDKYHFLAKVHTASGMKSIGGQSSDMKPADAFPESMGKARRGFGGDSLDLPVAAQYRQFKDSFKKLTRVGRSPIHGRGLFSACNLEKDQLIIEYVGELIRSNIADVREKYYDSKKIGCYMFRIDEDWVVDATKMGNAARYVNHSCNPNCEARVITVDSVKKIVIYAAQDIPMKEELTYDYKFPIEEQKLQCHCGAVGCRGTMN